MRGRTIKTDSLCQYIDNDHTVWYLQQVGTKSGGRRDMPLSRIWLITDYHENESFSLVKCIRRYVYNGPLIILVLVWCKSINPLLTKMREKRFVHFRSSAFWPFNLKSALIYSCPALCYQYMFLRLSCFEKLGDTGPTDGQGATLNAAPSHTEGHIYSGNSKVWQFLKIRDNYGATHAPPVEKFWLRHCT